MIEKILLLFVTFQFVSAWHEPGQPLPTWHVPDDSDKTSLNGSYCHCRCLFNCSCYLQEGVVKLGCKIINFDIVNPPIQSLYISNVPENENFVLQHDTLNFGDVTDFNFITFTNNTIKSIHVDAFKNILHLTFLNLSGNHLTELPYNMLQKNKQLLILDLSNNPLKISQSINPFLIAPSVQILYLSNCGLRDAPTSAFTYFYFTEVLHLTSNYLTIIDNTTFMYLILLQELHLSQNQIKSIAPNTFIHNPHLTKLYLNENPIITLESVEIPNINKLEIKYCQLLKIDQNTFSGLTNLVELNLKGNIVEKVDQRAFSDLKELMYLDLSENNLSIPLHPETFMFNQKIETVIFSNNSNMKMLPQEGFYGQFINITKIDLSDCSISDLNEFSFMNFSQVQYLNLSGNCLQIIRKGTLKEFLTSLDLSRNQISDLSNLNIPCNNQIRILILRENPLQKLNATILLNIRYLTILDISFCKIKTLWGNQYPEQSFRKLESLYLQNNNIQSLSPTDMDKFGFLLELNIRNNPLRCDNSFNSLMDWLVDNKITESSMFVNQNLDNHDMKFGWQRFATNYCDSNNIHNVPGAATTDKLESSLSVVILILGLLIAF